MRGRKKFSKAKTAINIFIFFISLLPFKARQFLFRKSQMIQGLPGLGIRYCLLKTLANECGENVSVHPCVFIFSPENLSLGSNISIHPLCYIEAAGSLQIGNNVSIAHGVTIMTTTHTYSDPDTPIKDQMVLKQRVIIEDNVWIGAKATILSGKTIHAGSIVAAGSVVTKDVPPSSVVAGVPASVKKCIAE